MFTFVNIVCEIEQIQRLCAMEEFKEEQNSVTDTGVIV